jgi:hypothetical protein
MLSLKSITLPDAAQAFLHLRCELWRPLRPGRIAQGRDMLKVCRLEFGIDPCLSADYLPVDIYALVVLEDMMREEAIDRAGPILFEHSET